MYAFFSHVAFPLCVLFLVKASFAIWKRFKNLHLIVGGLFLTVAGDAVAATTTGTVEVYATFVNRDVIPHLLVLYQVDYVRPGETVALGGSSAAFVPTPWASYGWEGQYTQETVAAGTSFDWSNEYVAPIRPDGQRFVLVDYTMQRVIGSAVARRGQNAAVEFSDIPVYLDGEPETVTVASGSKVALVGPGGHTVDVESDLVSLESFVCVLIGVLLAVAIWPRVFKLFFLLGVCFPVVVSAQLISDVYQYNGYQVGGVNNYYQLEFYVPNGSAPGTYNFCSNTSGTFIYATVTVNSAGQSSNPDVQHAIIANVTAYGGTVYNTPISYSVYGVNLLSATNQWVTTPLLWSGSVELLSPVQNTVGYTSNAVPVAITQQGQQGVSPIDFSGSFSNFATMAHTLTLTVNGAIVGTLSVPAGGPQGPVYQYDFGSFLVPSGATWSISDGSQVVSSGTVTPGEATAGFISSNGGSFNGGEGAVPSGTVTTPGADTSSPAGGTTVIPGEPGSVLAPPTPSNVPAVNVPGAPTGGGGSGGAVATPGGGSMVSGAATSNVDVMNVDDFYDPFYKALEDVGMEDDPGPYNTTIQMVQPQTSSIFGSQAPDPPGLDNLEGQVQNIEDGAMSAQQALFAAIPTPPVLPTGFGQATLTWNVNLRVGAAVVPITLDLEPYASQVQLIRDILRLALAAYFWMQIVRTIRGGWTTPDGN